MCATKTYFPAIEIQPRLIRRSQPNFVSMLMLIVDAFREARAMQRAALGKRLLNDE